MNETSGHPRQQSIFFIELDKVKPNPQQPRKEFDEAKLSELADSIRQYGVLQPLVVVRREEETPSGIAASYELIAGERRLRAARLAGLRDVPVLIREEPPEKVKLEMALVENLQREDLNPLDRAEAFRRLNEEFLLSHKEIGEKVGRSREYVANSIRLLALPSEVREAIRSSKIFEGHARPLLMLSSRPEEQKALFDDIVARNLSVREAERVSRRITSRLTPDAIGDPWVRILEEKLSQSLGTRVSIEKKGAGGKISIDFFSDDDLHILLAKFGESQEIPDSVSEKSEAAALPRDLEEFTI